MKFLRVLIIIIVILAVIVGILSLVAPKEVTVSRSATINAPKDVVFNHMSHFKDWDKWSPWHEMDPNMTITFKGEDGTVGSGYHWVGTEEKKTGEGEMTNTGLSGDTMKYSLNFLKPFKSTADGMFIAEDAGNGMTKATWQFHTKPTFPGNIFALFMNMDKMLGKDFEHGLDNLKKLAEAGGSTSGGSVAGMQIEETQFAAHSYAGIRQMVKWEDMSRFFSESYEKLGKAAGPDINGPAAGLFYKWDTVAHNADAVAAMPVSKEVKADGVTMIKVPASKAYMIVYKGGYTGSMKAHEALNEKVRAAGRKADLIIEEYIKGPAEEKDSTKWVTNIYYLIK